MEALFLKHPREAGETYLQHLGFAFGSGLRLVGAGLACIAHALVPAVFQTTASVAVAELHQRFARRSARQD